MTIHPEPKDPSMPKRRQRGFSLLELLVALMIIGVIATLGFRQYQSYTNKANYTRAMNFVKIMADGLDRHFIQYGKYPSSGTWDTLIAPDSALVVKHLIPTNMPATDPWGQPYEVSFGKSTYVVKCAGDPNNQEDFGEYKIEPGTISNPGGGAAQGAAVKGEETK